MFIADFHIHSKYSRATSKECVPEILELWARRKGLDLIGTGDFTHRAWREELKEKLVPSEEGIYTLKKEFRQKDDIADTDRCPRFIISGEISSIYKKNGKVRKVHNLLLLPSLEDAETLSRRLETIGNLHSDGRPILGLDCRDLLEIALGVTPDVIFVPAHIWTPHFSLFGEYSGFDDIKECFEDLTEHIHALETGLSSDPPMNWRLSALDQFTLISNSDAHSPANLAREANLFDTPLSYPHISKALENRIGFGGTIEFFPEEGKYHYDGHRNCKVCFKPSDTKAASGLCPVCGGRITVGVLNRVEALADRDEGYIPLKPKHFESLVPLHEVIASSMGLTPASAKVRNEYSHLIQSLGPELFILRKAPLEDIERKAGRLTAEGIRRLRSGKVEIQPGYDGEYGKIKIMDKNEISLYCGQLSLFFENTNEKPVISDCFSTQENLPEGNDLTDAPIHISQPASNLPYGLNPEQWAAVSASDRTIAVIAGPGTGKTKTLVNRIAYLIEECGVQPSQITAVTFTNKAADEMRTRLEQHFGNRRFIKDITIGTFHGICLQFLSDKNSKTLTVIDEPNALLIIQDILKNLLLKNAPRDVLRGISLIKNGASAAEENADVPSGVYGLYCGQLEQYGVLDYDDILNSALKIFESRDPEDKKYIGFTHLLVDEFQDINAVQYHLIKAWCKNSLGFFIIGDPDQSIYGFRGADSRYFQQFFMDFPGCRQIHLSRNYRSTPEIIRCAQSVILNNTAKEPLRVLEPGRKSGVKVRLLETDNSFSESLFIAKEINRMVGGIDMLDTQSLAASSAKRHVSGNLRGFSDIAILYRTNRQADALEQCLLQESIPYVVVGRDEFLSEPKVHKIVSFFTFLLNPHDLLSLRICLIDAILTADLTKEVLEFYAKSKKSISSIAGILKNTGLAGYCELAELFLKYEPLVRKEKPQKLIKAFMGDSPLRDLSCTELLLNIALMHEDMFSFLYNLALGQESDVVRSSMERFPLDAVSLMTLHGAKGLEFPVVFLSGVTDGMIPFRGRYGICNMDEERRLFYVGMTRAKDELILLTSQNPSPFLAGLPEELLVREMALAYKPTADIKQLSLLDL